MTEQDKKPKNIFEQIALGLQTINDNIVDLYKMVEEIHNTVYNTSITPQSSGEE